MFICIYDYMTVSFRYHILIDLQMISPDFASHPMMTRGHRRCSTKAQCMSGGWGPGHRKCQSIMGLYERLISQYLSSTNGLIRRSNIWKVDNEAEPSPKMMNLNNPLFERPPWVHNWIKQLRNTSFNNYIHKNPSKPFGQILRHGIF